MRAHPFSPEEIEGKLTAPVLALHHRAMGLTLLMLLSAVLPLSNVWVSQAYTLDEPTRKLIGEAPAEYGRKLALEDGTFRFNKPFQGPNGEVPAALLGTDEAKNLPSYDLAQDPSGGVTITDPETQLSFTLAPRFPLRDGQQQGGQVVYPLKGLKAQAVYTPQATGLKEDIVLLERGADEQRYNFELQIPDTLEARLTEGGAIGLYSADPALFGQISTGTEDDQVRIEAARENGAKNHLVFTIPAPVIKQSGEAPLPEATGAEFELEGTKLTVRTRGLRDLSYPVAIDPSVVVNSAASFDAGNNEGGMQIDSGNNRIKRSGLTGGKVNLWQNTTGLPAARWNHATVAYNNYIYVLGGTSDNVNSLSSVHYAPINGGTLGSWSSTTSLPTGRNYPAAVAYNGYMYLLGGMITDGTRFSDVQYARIKSDGTLGSWAATASFTSNRIQHTALAHNGYLYVLGGSGDSADLNDVQYAPLKADGTVGAWVATVSFTTPRYGHAAVAYNGHLYVFGGYAGGAQSGVQYAPINSDGTVGSWTETTAMTAGRYAFAGVVHDGYLYAISGVDGSGATNTASYAPINADGSVGTWRSLANLLSSHGQISGIAYKGVLYAPGGWTGSSALTSVEYATIVSPGELGGWAATTSLAVGRRDPAAAAYKGFLYISGGCCGPYGDLLYAPINADSSIGAWTATNAPSGARWGHQLIAHEGYMYSMGGFSSPTYFNDVQYAAINSDGTLGPWSATTSFTTARYGHGAVAYNGYLYITGGYSGSYQADTQYAAINTDGSIGSWATTASFAPARMDHAMVTYGARLYIFGGGGGSTYDTVLYAPVNINGTVGSWASTTSMTTGRNSHIGVVHNGYIYASGGRNSGGSLSVSEYAPINSDGTVGSWMPTSSLPAAHPTQGYAAHRGIVYSLAGCSPSSCNVYQTEVYYAPINNGGPGTTSSWANTTSFTGARSDNQAVAHNGYLYVLGGDNGNSSNVQYAPIAANGGVGAWTATSSLITGRTRFSAVAHKGYLYVLGGDTTGGQINTVEYAQVNSDGSLGAWATTTSFSGGRWYPSATVYRGNIYIGGGHLQGFGQYSDIQFAPINSNGTVGSWTTTSSFASSRAAHTLLANAGYLYVVAGNNFRDVQYAPINSNGTVGSWASTTPVGPVNHAYFMATIANGYMYVAGGDAGGATAKTIYAPINSNGTLGNWSTTENLPAPRYGGGSVYYNGYFYGVGGVVGGARSATVTYASLNSIPRTGSYSKLIDMGSLAAPIKYVIDQSRSANPMATINYRYADTSTNVFSAANNISSTDNGTPTAANSTHTRYVWLRFTVDDTNEASFGETAGSYLSRFQLFYRPISTSSLQPRLRGGSTLLDGVRSGIDAQP